MSDEVIRMNFNAMEAMAKSFNEASKDLADMEQKVKTIAGTLENGGLQGKAGAALVQGLREKFSKEILNLKEKIDELEKDVREAMHQMQNADEIASGYYKD